MFGAVSQKGHQLICRGVGHDGIPVGGNGFDQLIAQNRDTGGGIDGDPHPPIFHRQDRNGHIVADTDGLAGLSLKNQPGASSSL